MPALVHGLGFNIEGPAQGLTAHTFKGLLCLRINDTAPVISLHCLDQVESALLGVWGFSWISDQQQ